MLRAIRPVHLVDVAVLGILVAAVLIQSHRLERAERLYQDAKGREQARALEALGWEKAARAAQEELDATVPVLKAALAEARKIGATPVLTARSEGSVEWTLPDGFVCPAGDLVEDASAPAPDPGPPTLRVDVDVQTGVTADAAGGIHVKNRAWTTATIGTWQTAPTEVPELRTTATVAPVLEDALRAYFAPKPPRVALLPRPVQSWRAGWSCGGGGGVDSHGDPALVVGCVWGPQF